MKSRGSDEGGELDYEEYYKSLSGSGLRVLEWDGLLADLLEWCRCMECGHGPVSEVVP